jgi:hypothetical protein
MYSKSLAPPFQFDFKSILRQVKNLAPVIDGVSISLPFVSVTLKKPPMTEKKIARELVIRLADKRVLNAFECCDSCINLALQSIQEIRGLLVDKKVELSDRTDSGLYILLELMTGAIRQFLTFTERRDPYSYRQEYFAALEMLRAHLYRCLSQVAVIAGTKIPKISSNMRYDEVWDSRSYLQID